MNIFAPGNGMRSVFFLTLLPVLAVTAVMWQTLPAMTITPEHRIALVGPHGQEVQVNAELARTPEEQQKGLMFREELAPDAGMLFIFPGQAVLRSFWMKNTFIPLDIMFFAEDGRLVSLATMEPCTADPCPLYSSAEPATFVLEVNAGFAKEYGIAPGWYLQS